MNGPAAIKLDENTEYPTVPPAGIIRRLARVLVGLPRSEELTMEVFPGISMDPAIRFGLPCLVGTRVAVATVVGALGAGEPFEAVEDAFGLTHQQVLAALLYSAHVAAHLQPAVAA